MVKFILKKVARGFIILTDENKNVNSSLISSILIIDSGTHEHLKRVVLRARENFSSAKVEILTFTSKEAFIRENFPEVGVIIPGAKLAPDRYKYYFQMRKFRKRKFDVIILMSLDISSGFITLVSMRDHVKYVFLYNKWDETYLIRFRTLLEFFSCRQGADVKIQKPDFSRLAILWKTIFFIPSLIIKIGTVLYLMFFVAFINIKRDVRGLFK